MLQCLQSHLGITVTMTGSSITTWQFAEVIGNPHSRSSGGFALLQDEDGVNQLIFGTLEFYVISNCGDVINVVELSKPEQTCIHSRLGLPQDYLTLPCRVLIFILTPMLPCTVKLSISAFIKCLAIPSSAC